MAKHIGIVGCSAEGAALCYRTLCAEAPALMGEHNHPEISMHTPPLSRYMEHLQADNWQGVADLMLASAAKLVASGADLLICPDNTIHQAFDRVLADSPAPWLHIAEVVAQTAKQRQFTRLGLTGTRFLMSGPVYPDMLAKYKLSCLLPDNHDQQHIDQIIFEQLVNGKFTEAARLYFNEVIAKFRQQDCDAVILGCTEIPLLVDPDDCPLPVLDSTRLLAQAALRTALE